ncbi:MAG: peptidylprolyl isomerase [Xenococcaceae cyanobacterium MO_167.B27]|nr:peptidylprolyl isomerase [Xenococcaceae cyanobacterium MO_167.B27]
MKKAISVNSEDIFNHLKVSCQLPNILESIITCKIIESKAAEIGLTINLKELQKASDNFRLSQQLQTIQDTEIWLQKHHLSLDDFEKLIYTNVLSQKLVEHLFSDRVEAHFYQHQLDYAGAAIYEVLLNDEDIAIELYCALEEEEISFHEVARQYIKKPDLRRAGGYRGILSRRELPAEISHAVFATNPPKLLKPITTSTGIYLILVEEIIQPKFNEQIRKQILGELFSQWLQTQMKDVEIEIDLNGEQIPLSNGKAKMTLPNGRMSRD